MIFDFSQANTSEESQLNDVNESSISDEEANKKPVKKKKVSFKFGLETSDDAHIVKKEPNVSFAPPVSIIKKECLTRAIRIARGGESIIMPSRLTGLTQKFRNNNANNIDKLNSLTFKSQIAKSANKLNDGQSEESTEDQSDADEDIDEQKGNDACSGAESENGGSIPGDNSNAVNDSNESGVQKRSSHSSRVIKPNKRFVDEPKIIIGKNGVAKKKTNKIASETTDQQDAEKREGK